jgi:hypothetical protein
MVRLARLSKRNSHTQASQQITDLFEIIKGKLRRYPREKDAKVPEVLNENLEKEKK